MAITTTKKDLDGAQGSSRQVLSNRVAVKDDAKHDARNSHHPVRLDSYSPKLFYEKNDFSYIDPIADPNRSKRAGAMGYLPSAPFKALLPTTLL